jgi:hypothetical protein
MISSIREILGINDEGKLLEMVRQFDADLERELEPLNAALDQNIRTTDFTSLANHMGFVESRRAKVVRYLSLATAFLEYSKSESFLRKKEKGMTEADRRAHEKQLSAGFQAQVTMLDGLVKCIDSRVNLCKKLLEADGAGQRSYQQAA